ncbi:MAG: hypothetical protein ACRBFS_22980 [Aureispira sp.]
MKIGEVKEIDVNGQLVRFVLRGDKPVVSVAARTEERFMEEKIPFPSVSVAKEWIQKVNLSYASVWLHNAANKINMNNYQLN